MPNAGRTASRLILKGAYNEPDCCAENDSISRAVRFSADGSVRPAFHKFFQRNAYCLIYEDKPTLKLLDLGPPGNSPGGVYHFFAPLHSSPGGPVIGEVFGSKTLIKMATDANPNLETPAAVLFFTFADHQDQIVALGAFDYPATAGEFEAGQPVVRAIHGKYMGARGQMTSTRNGDGWYTQVFTLLK